MPQGYYKFSQGSSSHQVWSFHSTQWTGPEGHNLIDLIPGQSLVLTTLVKSYAQGLSSKSRKVVVLLWSVMMEKGSRLTKASMEHRNYFQCYYNNVGYCKFRGQCRYQHYTRICPRSVCKDMECKSRHLNTCKFGSECLFLTRKCCFFNHKGLQSDVKVSQDESVSENLLNEVSK